MIWGEKILFTFVQWFPCASRGIYTLQLLSVLFYLCQIGLYGWYFNPVLTNYYLLVLSITKRGYKISIMTWIYAFAFNSISFCFIHLNFLLVSYTSFFNFHVIQLNLIFFVKCLFINIFFSWTLLCVIIIEPHQHPFS